MTLYNKKKNTINKHSASITKKGRASPQLTLQPNEKYIVVKLAHYKQLINKTFVLLRGRKSAKKKKRTQITRNSSSEMMKMMMMMISHRSSDPLVCAIKTLTHDTRTTAERERETQKIHVQNIYILFCVQQSMSHINLLFICHRTIAHHLNAYEQNTYNTLTHLLTIYNAQ